MASGTRPGQQPISDVMLHRIQLEKNVAVKLLAEVKSDVNIDKVRPVGAGAAPGSRTIKGKRRELCPRGEVLSCRPCLVGGGSDVIAAAEDGHVRARGGFWFACAWFAAVLVARALTQRMRGPVSSQTVMACAGGCLSSRYNGG